jgi:hypothetical protein
MGSAAARIEIRRAAMTRWMLAVALSFGAAQGDAARAGEVGLPPPGRDHWRPLAFPKVSRETVYTPVELDGREAVRAESRCSASALLLRLEALDLERTPRLRWEWRVERDVAVADHRIKEGDDFAARVYVLFEFRPESAGVWERLRRRATAVMFGSELPGNAVNYVWSSREPAGAVWDNPFTAHSRMVSRGAGPLGVWRSEEVDVLADYRARFGAPVPPVVAVAVMSDSDNSCQAAEAYLARFRFGAGTEDGPKRRPALHRAGDG